MRSSFAGEIGTALLLLAMLSCGRKPHRDAQPPFGAFDFPLDGGLVGGLMYATGWALAEGGVAKVDLYLDRKFLQEATLKIKRPDVLRVYPAFGKVDDVGWTTDLRTDTLPVGKHVLTVRITSRGGVVTDLEPHRVTIEH